MKLRKTSVLILIVGVFVIALAGLGAVRSKQMVQERDLSRALTAAQARLNGFQIDQLSQKKSELEARLGNTITQSNTDRERLSGAIDSLGIGDMLFQQAQANGVEVMQIASSGLSTMTLEGIKCSTLQVTAKIKGDIPNLLNYISVLNANLSTGVVTQANITVPDRVEEDTPTAEEEDTPTAEEDTPTASIQITIYQYQED